MSGTLPRLLAVVLSLAAIAAAVPIGARIGAALRPQADGPYRAVVSIPPLTSLVEGYTAGSDAFADVDSLVPPGASEHGYEIPPSKLAALARADLVVLVGLGMEPQIEKFLQSNPRQGRRIIRFADVAGIEAGNHDHDHDHGHDHDHDHGPVDPHLWLDPVLVEKLVAAIGAALKDDAGPRADGSWDEAIAAQTGRVRDVHAAYEQGLGDLPRRTIVVGHDAWGHLAQRYNLETVAIKGLTANEPTPAAIQAAIKTVRSKGVTTVFVEPQLSQDAGRRIAQATGAAVAVLDPLGDGDWEAMMRKNLEALVAALSD